MTLNKEISDLGKVHILGLGGAGMSGIARLLSAQGVEVSGTDAKESRRLEALRKIGVNVFVGHSPENLKDCQTVIHSTAIKENNPELKAARDKNLKVLRRADALGVLTRQFETIAVSGTHGKTTTTSMVTVALQACGEDPSFAIVWKSAISGPEVLLGHDHAVDDMDHAIVSHDIRGGDFCFVDHDAAHGGDRDFRALYGFDIADFNVCRHHFTGNNMVGEIR